jgi:leucyl aminopeptidase (aminopeptidase T)
VPYRYEVSIPGTLSEPTEGAGGACSERVFVRTDVMIGRASVDVEGLDTDGKAAPVIRGDVRQLAQ